MRIPNAMSTAAAIAAVGCLLAGLPGGLQRGPAVRVLAAAARPQPQCGRLLREYEDTDVGAEIAPVEGDGWRAHLGASWMGDEWLAAGAYSLYTGHGAYKSSVEASVGRNFGPRYYLGVHGSATQQFAEFLRTGPGRMPLFQPGIPGAGRSSVD